MNNFDHVNFAVTICDKDGVITYMNEKAQATFLKYGGKDLIGKSLFDCHNPTSVSKIKELLQTGETNSYTIKKNGEKKLIYQTPHYQDGKIEGLIELSLVIPIDMPHFIR